MVTYTNKSLQSINKKDVIPIVLSLQNKLNQANNKLLEEIRKLNDNFSKFESKLSVTKQVNSLLSRRHVNMERQCWGNAQYSRQECLDIIRIPSDVEPDVLEEKVVNIFEKLGCNIPSNHIEPCHRVSKKSATVIVKYSRRKDGQKVLAVKKDLRKLKMEDIGLPGQNKFFINKNLCPYYKFLWSKIKKLHSLSKINSFFLFRVIQSRLNSMKIVCLCP